MSQTPAQHLRQELVHLQWTGEPPGVLHICMCVCVCARARVDMLRTFLLLALLARHLLFVLVRRIGEPPLACDISACHALAPPRPFIGGRN